MVSCILGIYFWSDYPNYTVNLGKNHHSVLAVLKMFINKARPYEFFVWPIFFRPYQNFSWNLLKMCIAIFIWHDKRRKKKLYLSHIERNLFQLNCISIESLDYANNYCGVLCFLFKEKKVKTQKYSVGFFLSFILSI